MSDTPDLSGRQVGRYKLLSPLGAGGMGVVYDAIDLGLDRRVAVKVLRPESVSDPARVQRFIREARNASALSHPNVVSVYEIGVDDGPDGTVHFIAMEKVDGMTLRQAVAAGSLSLRQRLELLIQVCDAVAAAHAAGIVHRDLKPENVMVSAHGYAKVLDFGLAKLRDEDVRDAGESASTAIKSTSTGVILGTAGYMSPEQARGLPADHRTDIFALGCVLHEFITGHRAFRGATAVDTLHEVIHGEPEPIRSFVRDAPEPLQRIIGRALEKDPARRYQAVNDLALDLREVVEEMEWKHRSGRSKRADLSGVRRSAVLAAAALALLVVIAVVTTMRPRGAAPPSGTPPSIRIERITNSGDVINVAISPDGKYVAFVPFAESQSLRLRQLATGRELELVRPSDAGIWGVTFTPDSSAVVYGRKGGSDMPGTLYRVPVIGGPPERILTDLYSGVTFSPDGEQLAWVRSDFPERGQSALMAGRRDGSGIRAVAVRRKPERFSPIYFCAPSWSPDGSMIAAVVANEDTGTTVILGFDPATGDARRLADREWAFAGALEWMPDMSGVLAVAADSSNAPPQIWFLPWPSGSMQRVTNDVFRYRSLSISADGRNLATVASDQTTRVWVMPLDGSRPPERITDGTLDGWRGVSYMPDGRLLFSSENHLARASADGTGREDRRNFFDSDTSGFLAFSGVVYFLTWGGEIGVADFDRPDRRIVVTGAHLSPFAVSPDGTWLAYTSSDGLRLSRVTVDGGASVPIGNFAGLSPAFSPTGDRIAFLQRTTESTSSLVVIDSAGSQVLWRKELDSPAWARLHWMKDGSGLILNNPATDGDIWLQRFDGSRTRLLATPSTENIYAFDLSPDGSSIAFSRGIGRRDAYLITGFR
jgi:eukaryotic-like serine/threonine-protein kinase